MRQQRAILLYGVLQPAPQDLFTSAALADEALRRAQLQSRQGFADPVTAGVEQRVAGSGQTLLQSVQAFRLPRETHLGRALYQACEGIAQSMPVRVNQSPGAACKPLFEVIETLRLVHQPHARMS